MVIELKKDVQQLDEIVLTNEPDQPEFEEETHNTNLQKIIKDDIQKNPHLYNPGSSLKGPNIFAIIGLAAKLFKKKNKNKTPVVPPITYQQLETLISKSYVINKRLLVEDLKIPEQYLPLFYDYCEAKQLSGDLLEKSKEIYLLDAIILNSKEFLLILEEFKKEQVIKD